MNTDHRLRSRRDPTLAAGKNIWAHVLIWVLVTVAAVLLVGFTALMDDITQRGELRRLQQRVSGSLMLPDEPHTFGVDVVRLLTMTGDKFAGR